MLWGSPKLFWNGVPDRMICLLVRISAKAFQIAIFGRLLLYFVPKSELSYLGLRSKTILESFVPSCACYFRLMMKLWIYSILWHRTTWHIEYVDEIRKNWINLCTSIMGAFLINLLLMGAFLINPLLNVAYVKIQTFTYDQMLHMSKLKLWYMIKCCICQNSNFDIWSKLLHLVTLDQMLHREICNIQTFFNMTNF